MSAAVKNGCFNRPDVTGSSYPVQDGWLEQPMSATAADKGLTTRIPIIKQQPHNMSGGCIYGGDYRDPKCEGCDRQTEELKKKALQEAKS